MKELFFGKDKLKIDNKTYYVVYCFAAHDSKNSISPGKKTLLYTIANTINYDKKDIFYKCKNDFKLFNFFEEQNKSTRLIFKSKIQAQNCINYLNSLVLLDKLR